MKRLIFVLGLGALLLGCTTTSNVPVTQSDNIKIEEEDQEEYELIIIDPGFDQWFTVNAKPASFYSLSYYESKNKQYVTAWNDLYYQYNGRGPFENRINYEFNKDYGLDLNYKLFWYFKYVEARYGRRFNFPT